MLDDGVYPTGTEVSDQEIQDTEARWIDRGPEKDPLSYVVLPRPRPAPEPGPGPERPGRVPHSVLNHPALTGIPAEDLDALAARLETPLRAALEQKYWNRRGGPRAGAARGTHPRRVLNAATCLLALGLRRHLALPDAVTGALLGIERSSISRAAGLAIDLLDANGITLPDTPPPDQLPSTPGELLAHAAANGITLTIPENGHPMPERFWRRKSKTSRDTPETVSL